ncbi:hypothetical protein ACNQ1H_28745 [Enterobacter cloacae complex sp.6722787]|uniref:hypothetical protein n=1 Tax=Enterobacter cloacae complex sp.6722787 TaxID=3397174 RepID=UPI003AADAC41
MCIRDSVERVMVEDKLPPKEATRKSMGQIQGALVGIAMVLSCLLYTSDAADDIAPV